MRPPLAAIAETKRPLIGRGVALHVRTVQVRQALGPSEQIHDVLFLLFADLLRRGRRRCTRLGVQ